MSTIVAGVDGSLSARQAVAWAAAEAGRRGDTLRLIHAYLAPEHGYPPGLSAYRAFREALRKQGEDWLREARDAANGAVPGVAVETDIVEGAIIPALIAESRQVRMVVLGSRGLGAFTGIFIGSVAVALAQHGHCPVAVVRGQEDDEEPPTTGPVVVGMDDSEAATAAAGFAFEEAALRGVPLVALHSWNDMFLMGSLYADPLNVEPEGIDAEERTRLEQQLAGLREKYPDVPVETVIRRGGPARALLREAERAQLVVVGSRGRGGFKGMLLGSTSQSLVMHAPCPVVVVRHPAGQS